MGYRSEVSLVITRELFGKMMQEIPEETKEMISYAERFESKEDSILLYWDYIKWYEDTYPINKFHSFLKEAADYSSKYQNHFHFIRLGEDRDDNVELGSYHSNPFEAVISRSISIYSSGENVDVEAFI